MNRLITAVCLVVLAGCNEEESKTVEHFIGAPAERAETLAECETLDAAAADADWLGQILNFATFKLLIYVLSLTIILMLERALIQTDLLPATMGMFYFAGVTVTGIIFFFLLPSIAASLSSGAQASTGMLQRAAERYLGRHLGGGGGGNNHTGSASKR